jgi:hypothetical protein
MSAINVASMQSLSPYPKHQQWLKHDKIAQFQVVTKITSTKLETDQQASPS